MRKIILLAIVTIAVLTQACIRDTGNYDYRDINQLQFVGFEVVEIDNVNGGVTHRVDSIIGRSSANPINVEDPQEGLWLTPVIRTSMNTEENLVFTWLTIDTLGNQAVFHEGRNLEDFRVLSGWSGTTTVTFRIEDVVSRKILNTNITLNVVNRFQTGYLVLQEYQGYMRLDMLSWLPGVRYTHFRNVLDSTDVPFPRQRGARYIVNIVDHVRAVAFGGRSIYIVTDEPDVFRIRPLTFDFLGDQGHLRNAFLPPSSFPDTLNVTRFASTTTNSALLNMEGNLFYQSQSDNRFFSIRWNMTEEREFFRASRHFSRASQRYVVFDEDAQSFYTLTPYRFTFARQIPARDDTLTSFRNMGKELVFSGYSSSFITPSPPVVPPPSPETLSDNILLSRDANGNVNEFWMLRFIIQNFRQLFWQRMEVPPGFADYFNGAPVPRPVMAVGGEFAHRQMYIAVGGNVYQYDLHNNRSTRVLTLPPGEVITYMGFITHNRHADPDRDHPNHGRDAHRFIIIAHYNAGSGVGTLTHYRIPAGTASLIPYINPNTGQLHSWTGFGRIVDVSF